MRFVVISGRSGSGKSTALHLLEDEGFTCVDNLPVTLLPAFVTQVSKSSSEAHSKVAVGIDARNIDGDLSRFSQLLEQTARPDLECQIVYLDASDHVLLKRFSETRRKHPLTSKNCGLTDAIAQERRVLGSISSMADTTIDTSNLSVHELRSVVKKLVVRNEAEGLALTFVSFGFKHGMPPDADFVFDVRCLPNPYWCQDLRLKTGLEDAVAQFLRGQPEVESMYQDIHDYLVKWIPCFEKSNRSYLTIAIGCTGGMHRSVYLCDRLSKHFAHNYPNVQSRHRQLEKSHTHG
jgi:UPF0042 nucleotide-binding protein